MAFSQILIATLSGDISYMVVLSRVNLGPRCGPCQSHMTTTSQWSAEDALKNLIQALGPTILIDGNECEFRLGHLDPIPLTLSECPDLDIERD